MNIPTVSKPKTILNKNRRLVLNYLRGIPATTVTEISEEIGLSTTTVSKIVDFLVERGLVVVEGKQASTGGKRPDLFQFNPGYAYAIGIQIRSTKVLSALTNLAGEILDTFEEIIREDESLPTVVAAIARAVHTLMSARSITSGSVVGVAVGAHGITNSATGVSLFAPHFPSWGFNVPLRSLIEEALGPGFKVLIDNQIRFQVFAEKMKGVAAGFQDIVVIEGGEGLVAGIIRDGVIQRGIHHLAGEIGHLPLDSCSDQVCHCGAKGCFEVLVSAGNVERQYRELNGISNGPRLREIFQLANDGEHAACKIIDEVVGWFVRGIATVVLLIDPEIVVFQGAYAEAGPYFLDGIRKQLRSIALPKVEKVLRFEYSSLGNEACLIGAAVFLIEDYFSRDLSIGEASEV